METPRQLSVTTGDRVWRRPGEAGVLGEVRLLPGLEDEVVRGEGACPADGGEGAAGDVGVDTGPRPGGDGRGAGIRAVRPVQLQHVKATADHRN